MGAVPRLLDGGAVEHQVAPTVVNPYLKVLDVVTHGLEGVILRE